VDYSWMATGPSTYWRHDRTRRYRPQNNRDIAFAGLVITLLLMGFSL